MFRYQELSANQWYIARLALLYAAPSCPSDAASSSFVLRFQRPGGSSLFFAYFRVSACSDSRCCLIRCEYVKVAYALQVRDVRVGREAPHLRSVLRIVRMSLVPA